MALGLFMENTPENVCTLLQSVYAQPMGFLEQLGAALESPVGIGPCSISFPVDPRLAGIITV